MHRSGPKPKKRSLQEQDDEYEVEPLDTSNKKTKTIEPTKKATPRKSPGRRGTGFAEDEIKVLFFSVDRLLTYFFYQLLFKELLFGIYQGMPVADLANLYLDQFPMGTRTKASVKSKITSLKTELMKKLDQSGLTISKGTFSFTFS